MDDVDSMPGHILERTGYYFYINRSVCHVAVNAMNRPFKVGDIVIAEIGNIKLPPNPITDVWDDVFTVQGFPYFKTELTLVTPAKSKIIKYQEEWRPGHLVTGGEDNRLKQSGEEKQAQAVANQAIKQMTEQQK